MAASKDYREFCKAIHFNTSLSGPHQCSDRQRECELQAGVHHCQVLQADRLY